MSHFVLALACATRLPDNVTVGRPRPGHHPLPTPVTGNTASVFTAAPDNVDVTAPAVSLVAGTQNPAWVCPRGHHVSGLATDCDRCTVRPDNVDAKAWTQSPGAWPSAFDRIAASIAKRRDPDCGEYGHDKGACGNAQCTPRSAPEPSTMGLIVAIGDAFADARRAVTPVTGNEPIPFHEQPGRHFAKQQHARTAYSAGDRPAPTPTPASDALELSLSGTPLTRHPFTPSPSPGDWPEDFAHENGQYQCRCCHCGLLFIGHKRRVSCRVCAAPVTGNERDTLNGQALIDKLKVGRQPHLTLAVSFTPTGVQCELAAWAPPRMVGGYDLPDPDLETPLRVQWGPMVRLAPTLWRHGLRAPDLVRGLIGAGASTTNAGLAAQLFLLGLDAFALVQSLEETCEDDDALRDLRSTYATGGMAPAAGFGVVGERA